MEHGIWHFYSGTTLSTNFVGLYWNVNYQWHFLVARLSLLLRMIFCRHFASPTQWKLITQVLLSDSVDFWQLYHWISIYRCLVSHIHLLWKLAAMNVTNEESSVEEAAPLAMTTKEATLPSHHDKLAAIVKSQDLKHHDTDHLPRVTT